MRQAIEEVILLPAWQRKDAKIEADAIALWQRLGVLPATVESEERAKELCSAAYLDGTLVGVSTVTLDMLPQLRCRFGFFRCLVDPTHRQKQIGRRLAVHSREVLCAWSKDHPEAEIAGMAAVIETKDLGGFEKEPFWPASGLTLIGYTPKGQQLRVTWFEHIRLHKGSQNPSGT